VDPERHPVRQRVTFSLVKSPYLNLQPELLRAPGLPSLSSCLRLMVSDTSALPGDTGQRPRQSSVRVALARTVGLTYSEAIVTKGNWRATHRPTAEYFITGHFGLSRVYFSPTHFQAQFPALRRKANAFCMIVSADRAEREATQGPASEKTK
jgi:hypothetical protein